MGRSTRRWQQTTFRSSRTRTARPHTSALQMWRRSSPISYRWSRETLDACRNSRERRPAGAEIRRGIGFLVVFQKWRWIAIDGDCSRATGFIRLVHDKVMQGFVDGLRLELHATYRAQDAH